MCNEKPTLRKDFYWDILGESLDICSAIFTVTSPAECFLLCPSLIHTDDYLCLILQKDFPQIEERVEENSCQLLLLAIICLSCMELMWKCKFSSYCFLNYTWLLVIAEIRNGDILIKSQCADVFIYFHMKKLVFF